MRTSTALISLVALASTACAKGEQGQGPQPKRFGMLVLENTDYATANANPVFQKIYSFGRSLSQYSGVEHPSLPNYVATVAGTTFGIKDDNQYNLTGSNVVDLLEAKNVDWKVYAEDYPGNCYLGATAGGPHHYAEKHVPHLEFVDNRTPQRCSKIVSSDQFWTDVKNQQLPAYWFYVPNLENDGHDSNTSA
jgi:hypothetical protein